MIPIPDELPPVGRHPASTTDELRELHEAYANKINSAVAEGCWNDIGELSDAFVAESMALMVARS